MPGSIELLAADQATPALWATLLDRLPLATCVVDGQGIIQWTNAAFGTLLPTSIAPGRSLPALLSGLASEVVRDACARVPAASSDEHTIPLPPCPELHEGRAGLALTVIGLRAAHEPPLVACCITMADGGQTRHDLDAAQAMVVATITHELRTPLTSIKGFAYALRTRHERLSDTRRQEYLEIIEAQADYLTGVIDELLEMARQEEGRISVHPLPLDVMALIRRAIVVLGPRVGSHEIVTEEADGLPQVMADPVRGEQILRNLLDNAIKYAPAGTRIEIGVQVEGGKMVVSVRDQGIGIPTIQQSMLFQRFSRIDNPTTRASRGMGLGLYLARMLVEAMGGRIWVESEEGRGATFAFTLPLA